MKKSQHAFTLIELVIAVAIVGVLAAIAVPSYLAYMNKSKEAEARAALESLATVLNQYRMDNNTYVGASLGPGGVFADQVPVDGNNTQTYVLAITGLTATTFTITATPVDPSLTIYTLDESGNKTPAGW